MIITVNYQGEAERIRETPCREYAVNALVAQPYLKGATYDFSALHNMPGVGFTKTTKLWEAYISGIIPIYCNMFGLLFDKADQGDFTKSYCNSYPFCFNNPAARNISIVNNYGVSVDFQKHTIKGVPAEWVHSPAIMSLLLYLFRIVYNPCDTIRVSPATKTSLKGTTYSLPLLFNSLLSYLYWPISHSYNGNPGVFYTTLAILSAIQYEKRDELVELLKTTTINGMNEWVYYYHIRLIERGLFEQPTNKALEYISKGKTYLLARATKPLY